MKLSVIDADLHEKQVGVVGLSCRLIFFCRCMCETFLVPGGKMVAPNW